MEMMNSASEAQAVGAAFRAEKEAETAAEKARAK